MAQRAGPECWALLAPPSALLASPPWDREVEPTGFLLGTTSLGGRDHPGAFAASPGSSFVGVKADLTVGL